MELCFVKLASRAVQVGPVVKFQDVKFGASIQSGLQSKRRWVSCGRMKASYIFKLAVRMLGLIFLYQAVHTLAAVIPLLTTPTGRNIMAVVKHTWGNYLVIMLLAGVAVWCLFGAPPIQRWAYPEDEGSSG